MSYPQIATTASISNISTGINYAETNEKSTHSFQMSVPIDITAIGTGMDNPTTMVNQLKTDTTTMYNQQQQSMDYPTLTEQRHTLNCTPTIFGTVAGKYVKPRRSKHTGKARQVKNWQNQAKCAISAYEIYTTLQQQRHWIWDIIM